MALPAIAALRAALPESTLAIAAIPSVAPLFGEQTDRRAEAVLTIPDEASREPQSLASGQFDAIVLLPNSFRSAWNARRAGVPRRWGFRWRSAGPLLTRTCGAAEGPSPPVRRTRRARSRTRIRTESGCPA